MTQQDFRDFDYFLKCLGIDWCHSRWEDEYETQTLAEAIKGMTYAAEQQYLAKTIVTDNNPFSKLVYNNYSERFASASADRDSRKQ